MPHTAPTRHNSQPPVSTNKKKEKKAKKNQTNKHTNKQAYKQTNNECKVISHPVKSVSQTKSTAKNTDRDKQKKTDLQSKSHQSIEHRQLWVEIE